MDRAERRRRTAKVVNRRIQHLKLMNVPITQKRVGRCKKHSPFDCGKPQCFICNGRMQEGDTVQERKAKISFDEQTK